MRHTIEEVRLDSGASGLLIDVPDSSVMNLRIIFRAGNKFVKRPEIYEVAHLMEHMAFGKNAEYRDEQAYEAEFTKNGAYHNAWTSDAVIAYEAECADFEWERVLALQELAVAKPKFNEEELKSEKGNVRAELTGYQNDYARLIWPKLQQALGEEVLTYSERLKTISNIEIKDIREHHRRTHTADNMQFIISGNLKGRKRKVVQMLNGWDLKAGEKFALPADAYVGTAPIMIRRKDASNLTFGFSFIIKRRLEPQEQYAMGCLNHILTGTMNSKIFGQARKRGLVYGVGSSTSSDAWSSLWDFDGEVNAENAEELFDLIAIELARVINGEVAETDIKAARVYALGRHQMLAQTAEQISDYYARQYISIGTYEPMADAPKMIEGIKKSTIVCLAREFMQSGISGLAMVGNMEKAVAVELWGRVLGAI
ncbi:MAG: insulinase family protein [Candidatus Nomurabacteria bacterium]|jgi:predicted Zn-dependent peptidase|nr:insulinase family protein [Candidatus Nomurabacteria bacterium]